MTMARERITPTGEFAFSEVSEVFDYPFVASSSDDDFLSIDDPLVEPFSEFSDAIGTSSFGIDRERIAIGCSAINEDEVVAGIGSEVYYLGHALATFSPVSSAIF
jgi:hypothetical protein